MLPIVASVFRRWRSLATFKRFSLFTIVSLLAYLGLLPMFRHCKSKKKMNILERMIVIRLLDEIYMKDCSCSFFFFFFWFLLFPSSYAFLIFYACSFFFLCYISTYFSFLFCYLIFPFFTRFLIVVLPSFFFSFLLNCYSYACCISYFTLSPFYIRF